jgi:microcompartment protein CcmK/EutM
MNIAQVVGTVVSTRKDEELEGLKLLVCKGVDLDGNLNGPVVVAADAVGAGVGEIVLYAAGSSARQTAITKNRPVDHVIMAIVDAVTEGGRLRYQKDPPSAE